MSQPFVISLLFVLVMLGIGFVLRAWLPPLRKLFIPASVVGGLIGLGVMQTGQRVGEADVIRTSSGLDIHSDLRWAKDSDNDGVFDRVENLADQRPPRTGSTNQMARRKGLSPGPGPSLPTQFWSVEISDTIDSWPGLLIAVVFGGLLMDKPGRRFGEAAKLAARQGIVVWIIVLGQAFVGLLACALLIAPFFDVPPVLGQLIETGFAGGHGTAAAMGEVMDSQFAFPAGRDLAFLFATAGLVYGVVSGIFFVNLGVRRGWLRKSKRPAAARTDGLTYAQADTDQPADGEPFQIPVVSGLEDRADPPASTFATVRSDVVDPLAFQLILLGVAFGTGMLLQQLFLYGAGFAPAEYVGYLKKIPLFLFTLMGGWAVREGMHLAGFGNLIDPPSIQRLTGIAMEILIVAALATLRLEAAATYLVPTLILLGVGFAWVAFCLLYVGRKLLPSKYWFELGLMNYGMSTATTAQGILLLRIVDRDLDSGAAEDYAAAAPMSAPFVGGGILTVLFVPLALAKVGFWPVLAVMAFVLVGLFFLGRSLRRSAES